MTKGIDNKGLHQSISEDGGFWDSDVPPAPVEKVTPAGITALSFIGPYILCGVSSSELTSLAHSSQFNVIHLIFTHLSEMALEKNLKNKLTKEVNREVFATATEVLLELHKGSVFYIPEYK